MILEGNLCEVIRYNWLKYDQQPLVLPAAGLNLSIIANSFGDDPLFFKDCHHLQRDYFFPKKLLQRKCFLRKLFDPYLFLFPP